MNYRQFDTINEPKIIGVNNGVCQVEIDDRSIDENVEHFFNLSDINYFIENQDKICKRDILIIEASLIKGAKLTYLMDFTPGSFILKHIVSNDLRRALTRSNNGNNSLMFLDINLKDVNANYSLLFVPIIPMSEVVFKKSICYVSKNRRFIKGKGIVFDKDYLEINSYSDFQNMGYSIHNKWEKIVLPSKYKEKSILKLQMSPHLFVAGDISSVIESSNLSNIRFIDKIILEFE